MTSPSSLVVTLPMIWYIGMNGCFDRGWQVLGVGVVARVAWIATAYTAKINVILATTKFLKSLKRTIAASRPKADLRVLITSFTYESYRLTGRVQIQW